MLGHKLWQTCAGRFDAHVTFRQSAATYADFGIFEPTRALGGVSVQGFDSVERAFAAVQPQVVVNCIGVVKQDAAAKDPVASITVNSLFPHLLAHLSRPAGTRLIHLSTDCVFSGRKGNYRESDLTDAQDLYGRTKVLGEVDYENCLTLRTSMIGRELQSSNGLIEWFLAQRGKTVRGFKRAVFSGFTTAALADVIGDIIADHPQLRGTWHVAADSINKFDLLSLVKQTYELDVQIEPDETFICDRSLDDGRFRQATGFAPRPWPEMIRQMAQDTTPYEEIRRNHAG